MKIIIVREYTENGVRFVFRDVEDNGRRWTQYLVKEPWGEEFWNDCDPDAESDVMGARPYEVERSFPPSVKGIEPEVIPDKPKRGRKKKETSE